MSATEEIATKTATGVDDVTIAELSPRHGRIDDIEILRAVAIIFVLIEHSRVSLFSWMGIGEMWFHGFFGFWNGVDLFFAISGFVIARSLMPSLVATRSTVAFFNATLAFWIRRVWRLVPSAWLWIAVVLIASVAFNRSGAFGSFRANFESAVAAILDVENFRISMIFGRFEPGATFPYWSLSLEEQFYLLLPFLILWSGRRLPLVLGIAVLLQLFIPRDGQVGQLGLVLNTIKSDAILLGVLIAIWSGHPTYRLFDPVFVNKRPWIGAVLLSGLVVLFAAIGSTSLHIVPFQVGLVALVSALLVLIASYDKNCFCPNGPLKRVMLWFGSRSYGLYLIHLPAYFATREIWYRIQPAGTDFTDRFAVRFTYTAAILLFVFAELNFRLVELPLRVHGARIAKHVAARFKTRNAPHAPEVVK